MFPPLFFAADQAGRVKAGRTVVANWIMAAADAVSSRAAINFAPSERTEETVEP